MENKPLQISFIPELKDILEAYTAYEKSTRIGRFFNVMIYSFIAFGLAFIIITTTLHTGIQNYFIGGFLTLIGVIHLSGFRLNKVFIKKNFKVNEKYRIRQKYTIHENGMDFESDKKPVTIHWEDFESFLESRSCFLLVIEKMHYLTIPKNAFPENTEDEFRKLAIQKIMKPH